MIGRRGELRLRGKRRLAKTRTKTNLMRTSNSNLPDSADLSRGRLQKNNEITPLSLKASIEMRVEAGILIKLNFGLKSGEDRERSGPQQFLGSDR